MAYYRDLREYIEALEEAGLLLRIKRPINKDTELHPLVRWQYRGLAEDQRRAFYFEDVVDIRGKKYDIPVLVAGLAGSRKIYAQGLMCDEIQMEETWSHALQNPIEPILIPTGSVKEVIHKGVDLMAHGGLEELPVPISTPGFDNGPYITAGCWITKDPETGVRNMGVYRGQIKGPLKTGAYWGQLGHCAMHWEKCNRLGIPLEAAIVIGGPPSIAYAAIQRVPLGVDELAIAGGLGKAAIEVVKCETVDLEVPAHCEIVIEGRIPTDYLEPDAPFGESHGHMDPGDLGAIFEVTCITHRRNPIYVSMISQVAPSESSKIRHYAWETFALNYLRGTLDMSVTHVALIEDLLSNAMAVIQLKRKDLDDPWRAMEGLMKSSRGVKIMICVDPDIEPYDLLSVAWAILNRSQPHRDVKVISHLPLPWNAVRYVADGERYDVTDSVLLIDATSKSELPPIALPKKEYMEQAKVIWEQLGLPALTPRPPWYGYSLGYWLDEDEVQANNAMAGNYYLNAKLAASKGLKVSKGERFEDLKKKFLSDQFEKMKKKIQSKSRS